MRQEAVLIDCPEDSSTALDLIDRLRMFSELPILVLTDTGEAGVHALRAGADSAVPKPVSRDELLLRIQRMLARSGHVDAVLGGSLVELDGRTIACSPATSGSTSARPSSASSRP